jgi:hypothetical protein
LNQVANQQISQVTFMVRIAFDESAKAESSSYSTINRRIWRVLLGRQVDGIEESVLLGSQTVVRSPESVLVPTSMVGASIVRARFSS